MSLHEPLTLGPRRAPNRLMFGPHETNLAWGRQFSERHVAYYQERAVGGCGVLVTEEASVHPSDWAYERQPDGTVADWSPIVAACRPHGTLVLAALGHSGGQGSSAFHQREMWAPSDEPEVNTREVPKIMETEDITAVVDGFRATAERAARCDVDGVEVNAGQHSLIRQFLSGLTNRRDDDYGSDRSRLAVEVLTAARAGLGPDRILGLRLSCDEMAPWAGITPEQATEIAAGLAPLVDYIVVVRGAIFSVNETRPTLHHQPGFNLDLARSIRNAVREAATDEAAPAIFAQGSIVDPGQAEWALADGVSDGVEMTRAQIAEPALGRKLGQPEQIRPCVLCNQLCKVRDNRNPIVSCIVNPRAGHETAIPEESAATTTENQGPLLVVGGGPAGLEAARVAAGAGRAVRLVEQSARLGGAARLASVTGAQQRIGDYLSWLESECRNRGVEILLETEADRALIEQWVAETGGEVVHAEGGQPSACPFPVTGGARVINVDALYAMLEVGTLPTGPVLFWDPTGGPTAVAAAEHLAHAGVETALLTPDAIAGNSLALSGDLAGSNVRLQQAGVQIHRRQKIRSVDGDTVHTEHTMTGESDTVSAKTIVLAGHRVPEERLWIETKHLPVPQHRVGDVVAPRTIAEAIREAREAVG